jgi:hypothetical protein
VATLERPILTPLPSDHETVQISFTSKIRLAGCSTSAREVEGAVEGCHRTDSAGPQASKSLQVKSGQPEAVPGAKVSVDRDREAASEGDACTS